MGSSSHQHRLYVGNGMPHQDVLSITEDAFGNVADALGVIMDVPCPLVHSLLYRNLAGYSLMITLGPAAHTW